MAEAPHSDVYRTFWMDEKHGPLPAFLVVLTFITGLVDAVSYLKLGHVFVANMTGNIVFLGFATAGAQDFSISASIVAIAAFLAGALGGGRLGAKTGQHRGRLLAIATYIKVLLIGLAFSVSLTSHELSPILFQYILLILLALAMGLQNAVARRLAVPDLTTTVLTLTLTGLAADSIFAGGNNPRPGRRVLATIVMFLGAAVGTFLVLQVGIWAVLLLALALQILNGTVAYRFSSSDDAWTAST
jgi:uncharacterized membrane protein YoaK (UPF0700 family)